MKKRLLSLLLCLALVGGLYPAGAENTGENAAPAMESVSAAASLSAAESAADIEPAPAAASLSAAESAADIEPSPAAASLSAAESTADIEPAPAAASDSEKEERPALPGVGDVLEGFEVREIREMEYLGGPLLLMEHQKTGAAAAWIANGDPQLGFCISFFTPPSDDTGAEHILEHSVIAGSEKYPWQDVLFYAIYNCFYNELNALSADQSTSFPILTMSEKQMLPLMDLYVDCCLHPFCMRDESTFRREGWRYEMTSPEGPLTINGTVYNEMKAALDQIDYARHIALKAAFPGSEAGFISVGDPQFIPELSWEKMQAFYRKYYHPSNSVTLFHGDFQDFPACLRLLDGYFSEYDRQERPVVNQNYTPLTEPVTLEVPWPMEAGSDAEHQSVIVYDIPCPGLRETGEIAVILDSLARMLEDESSPLYRKIGEAFPGSSLAVMALDHTPEPTLEFTLMNADPEDGERFRSVVNEGLKEMADQGTDLSLARTIRLHLKASAVLNAGGSSLLDHLVDMSVCYFSMENLCYFEDLYQFADRLEELASAGYFDRMIRENLTDPDLYCLLICAAAPGEKERREEELALHLEDIRQGMTEEERQAVVEATLSPVEEQEIPESIAALTPLTVAELPEHGFTWPTTDETGADGLRRITAEVNSGSLYKTGILLSVHMLPLEDLHYLDLMCRLMGELGTEQYDQEELIRRVGECMYYPTFRTQFNPNEDSPDQVEDYLFLSWIGEEETMAEAWRLAEDMLLHMDFSDTRTISAVTMNAKNRIRELIRTDGSLILANRQAGQDIPWCGIGDYANYLPLYAFLTETEKKLEENPGEVIAELERVRDSVCCRRGAVSLFAGRKETAAENEALTDAFLSALREEPGEKQLLTAPPTAFREGLAQDQEGQTNSITITLGGANPAYDGRFDVLSLIVTDRILMPLLRYRGGAYQALMATRWYSVLNIFTAADPNVKSTFEVMESLPQMIADLDITQEEIDSYIISNASEPFRVYGSVEGAYQSLIYRMMGFTPETEEEALREAKTFTPECLPEMAEMLSRMLENARRGTIGPLKVLQENRDLYDEILVPFGEK